MLACCNLYMSVEVVFICINVGNLACIYLWASFIALRACKQIWIIIIVPLYLLLYCSEMHTIMYRTIYIILIVAAFCILFFFAGTNLRYQIKTKKIIYFAVKPFIVNPNKLFSWNLINSHFSLLYFELLMKLRSLHWWILVCWCGFECPIGTHVFGV